MIRKQIEKAISVQVFLYEYIVGCYTQSLINKIDQVLKETNLNYVTNVKGKMTNWEAFTQDPNFLKAIDEGIPKLMESLKLRPMQLAEAWGLRHDRGDFTQEHCHTPFPVSGILYLSDKNTPLVFPELRLEVVPEKNSMVLFSGHLKHSAPINRSDQSKYAIAFNLSHPEPTWGEGYNNG